MCCHIWLRPNYCATPIHRPSSPCPRGFCRRVNREVPSNGKSSFEEPHQSRHPHPRGGGRAAKISRQDPKTPRGVVILWVLGSWREKIFYRSRSLPASMPVHFTSSREVRAGKVRASCRCSPTPAGLPRSGHRNPLHARRPVAGMRPGLSHLAGQLGQRTTAYCFVSLHIR